MRKRVISLAVSVALVTGCASRSIYDPNYEAIGAGVGGTLGGIGGAQIGEGDVRTAATIAGTLVGTAIGASIGRTMDEVDRLRIQRTLEHNRSHTASAWHNPDSEVAYTVTPRRTYQRAPHQYCREYIVEAQVNGQQQTVYGTACRQPDGSWRVR